MTKIFKGKAIYNPSGRAGEYSYWACNFYKGCDNNCKYCFCKRGVMASTWTPYAVLKSCFRNEEHAKVLFTKELLMNKTELQKCGLFLTFTSDPFLPKTIGLTEYALKLCLINDIPVKLLTKRADFTDRLMKFLEDNFHDKDYKKMIAIGFTLTGHDELEPGASTNEERIAAMRLLKEAGFIVWASIEPIIDFDSSLQMLFEIRNCCDLVKIGLESGRKYPKVRLLEFIEKSLFWANGNRLCADKLQFIGFKVYFKDGLLQQAGISRDQLPSNSNCVGRDYNIFKA